MTSASELFYNRRHRWGRTALDLELQSSPASHHHHRLHDADAGDSLRRHDHVRRLRQRSSYAEHASARFDPRHRRSLLNDGDDSAEDVRGIRGPRGMSDRLPVGVLHARARLLERLRGEPVSINRQNGRDAMGWDEESEISLLTDLTAQMGRSRVLRELNKKPPGLTQEALDCLHQEVFSRGETGSESTIQQDCSICLESFTDGDELIHLSCGHRFHSACLNPWVRCCGDCPYCRRVIVVNSHTPQAEAE